MLHGNRHEKGEFAVTSTFFQHNQFLSINKYAIHNTHILARGPRGNFPAYRCTKTALFLSTLCQCHWCRKPEYTKNTVNLYYIWLYRFHLVRISAKFMITTNKLTIRISANFNMRTHILARGPRGNFPAYRCTKTALFLSTFSVSI
jgi:hypothetical protein